MGTAWVLLGCCLGADLGAAWALHGRNGTQIAPSNTPRERQNTGARKERASARFANRRRGGRSMRPRCYAALLKCCTT
eukprot:2850935-Lingulodinium_polyedra.AAC.1